MTAMIRFLSVPDSPDVTGLPNSVGYSFVFFSVVFFSVGL